jgi:hypothetical protein
MLLKKRNNLPIVKGDNAEKGFGLFLMSRATWVNLRIA